MDVTPIAIILSLLAGIVPTVIYVLLIYWIDRYEKEPLPLLIATFVWGAIPAIVLALILEDIFGAPLAGLSLENAEVLSASLVAPVVEEIVKALALLGLLLIFRSEIDDVLDGIVYGAAIGLGFGMTENVFYFMSSFEEGGWAQWLVTVGIRSLLFGLMHAFYTGIVGAGLGYTRLAAGKRRRWWIPLAALGAAMLFHAFHNGVLGLAMATPLAGLAIAAIGDWTGILLLGVMAALALRKERGWIVSELSEEVAFGTLSATEYGALSGSRPRALTFWRLVRSEGWQRARKWQRLYQSAGELAFRKHRSRHRPSASALTAISRIRERIRAQRSELGAAGVRKRFCTRCGNPIKPDSLFCTRCGHRVPTSGGETS